MECPNISTNVELTCDTRPLKKSAYTIDEKSVYKDGVLYGNITHHDREKKAISFTMVSDNQFMNGVKSSLNYR